jgi:hypothetical protein
VLLVKGGIPGLHAGGVSDTYKYFSERVSLYYRSICALPKPRAVEAESTEPASRSSAAVWTLLERKASRDTRKSHCTRFEGSSHCPQGKNVRSAKTEDCTREAAHPCTSVSAFAEDLCFAAKLQSSGAGPKNICRCRQKVRGQRDCEKKLGKGQGRTSVILTQSADWSLARRVCRKAKQSVKI